MTGEDETPLRVRVIGSVYAEMTGSAITVEHVYEPGTGTCGNCQEQCRDAGMVGLHVHPDADGDGEGEEACASVLLSPAEALLLANRLERAAGSVLEAQEDAPDMDREAARFGLAPETAP